MSDAKIKNAGADYDRDNLRNAREFLRTPQGRPPFELDWAQRVLERLGTKGRKRNWSRCGKVWTNSLMLRTAKGP